MVDGLRQWGMPKGIVINLLQKPYTIRAHKGESIAVLGEVDMTVVLNGADDCVAVPCGGRGFPAISSLPDPAGSYARVSTMMNDARSSVADIGRVIALDSELTDLLLAIANSPIYGFVSAVESIPRAISLIGTRGLRDMMAAGAWGRALARMGRCDGHAERLWLHSLHCAILARMIARHLRVPYIEQFFVSGLLHDVALFTLHTSDVVAHQETGSGMGGEDGLGFPLARASDMNHGIDGAALLAEWCLSPSIIEPIVYHHDARQAKKYVRFCGIIQLADIAIEDQPEAVPSYLWRLCGLQRDELESLVARSHDILCEVTELFSEA